MKNIFRHLSSFMAPIVVCIVLPYFIVRSESDAFSRPAWASSRVLLAAGLVIGCASLALFIASVRMFILIGNGTIMPWDPTRKMIIAGPYRYVRNPMILGVIGIVTGESLVFASRGIGLLAIAFFVINTVYFIFSEEPGLKKRFLGEYIEYKKNVPRWIPRLRAWKPGGENNGPG
jgi:protein-S-isoprenylcysteine O-methyltransferase Ste14